MVVQASIEYLKHCCFLGNGAPEVHSRGGIILPVSLFVLEAVQTTS